MKTLDLLARLRRLGVRVRWSGDGPVVDDPAGVVDEGMRAELARHRAELRVLLAGAAGSSPPVPSTGTRRDEAPTSFAQRRLWFLEQLEPGKAAYNQPLLLCLSGRLVVPALRRVLDEIVRRHEVLRTIFAIRDGEPVQVVLPPAPVRLDPVDVEAATGAEVEVVDRAREAALVPFDLARGPVLRACLYSAGPERNWLLLCLHHIATDGWSNGVLRTELAALYGAFSRGRPSPLPELELQYADFAVWQRREAHSVAFAEHLDHWKERLAGIVPLTHAGARPRPPELSYRGERTGFAVPPPVVGRLRALAGESRTTLFVALLAAFKTLVFRTTGETDVVIGAPVAGRPWPELERSIGLFVNSLVLRTDLSGAPSFRELLVRVRTTVVDALEHQDVAFERLVEEVNPERRVNRNPLFDVMFSHQAGEPSPPPFGDLEAVEVPLHFAPVKFDLAVATTEKDGALTGSWQCSRDVFEAGAADRQMGWFKTLLEAVAERPDAPLAELPILPPEERLRVVEEWNRTSADLPRDRRVHELVEAQAARAAGAVAVEHGDRRLSYGELSNRARELAALLREGGVVAGQRVAIALPRSPEAVVAILAVLESGACYVPLDVDLPLERQRFIVRDAEVGTLIAAQAGADALGGLVASTVVVGPAAATTWRNPAPEHRRAVPVEPADLAYVIYTSGSTGVPKGVMIGHDGLVSYVLAAAETFGIGPGDRLLQFASLGYDISVEEIFLALTRGAALVIHDRQGAESTASFLSWCEQARLTVLFLPTALWGQLTTDLTEWSLRVPRSVRLVQIGGEAASPDSLARWHASVGEGVRLVNTYGPTEATVMTTWAELDAAAVARGVVPIGRPFANVRVYVLDGRGEPVPIGVAGELFIGGAGVAAGYCNRPELSAERFPADRFNDKAGARLYRTGDVVRWGADGQLEFLGRTDDQVKVRGHRVEPGEVEAVLGRHPTVQRAAVVARRDAGGRTELAAYLVPSDGATPSLQDVRAFLTSALPSAMIPSSFHLVDRLPLNAAGKVDRRALAAARAAPMAEASAVVAARDPIEQTLVGIWSDVLERDRIGVFDDFFALGGHSLRAVRAAARASQAFGVEVPVRALFETPTIAALARRVAASLNGPSGTTPPPQPSIGRVDRSQPLPLSFDQERVWFLEQLEPGRGLYNVPLAFRLEGEVDVAALERALTAIVRRHEVLRTTYLTVDGEPRQRVGPPVSVPVRMVDIAAGAEDPADAAEKVAADLASEPFDLGSDLMIRAALVRFAPGRSVLVITLHHIAADGRSSEIIAGELSRLYAAFRSGDDAPELEVLPVQFADFAAWQRAALDGDVLAEEVEWWRARLDGVPVLELPTDRPRPRVPAREGTKRWLDLPTGTGAAVRALARSEHTTPFRVLAALFTALLHRITGNATIAFGIPVRGRLHPDVEGVVGMFVNTVPMVVDCSDGPGFRTLVARADAATLAALDHQRLPFERLVSALGPDRELARNPLLGVMFGHTHGGAEIGLTGVAAEKLDLDRGRSKFDLTLETREVDGELSLRAEFSTELFEPATVERLLERFARLAAGALAAPDTPIDSLDLMGDAERRAILEEWGARGGTAPRDRSVAALFALQASRRGDATALVHGDERVTYAALAERAAVVAAALRARGVGGGDLVGLHLPRCAELVAATLGVLEAGAAYLPIATDEPPNRAAAIVTETGARLVVCREDSMAAWRGAGVTTVLLDQLGGEGSDPGHVPEQESAGDRTAYVMYTSGSTGVPKGIAIPHRAITRLVVDPSYVSIGPDDVVAHLSNPAFDASTFEVWGALLNGARLVILDRDEVLDPQLFAERVRAAGVTVAFLTTALFNELVVAVPEALGRLRFLLFGGEAAAPDRVRRLLKVAPPQRLVHVYGPTESTTFATAHEVTEVAEGAVTVPIGRPISDTACRVLDGLLQPVPIGVPGELYIGGGGLASGYVGNRALTEERFVPDPFATGPGGRLYRTGDIVRWRGDGQLEFMGRRDDQIKLRGFRVEPAEIEAALRRHPAVREAIVVPRRDRAGELALVAYAVPEADQAISAPDLRRFLRGALPPYMVPAAFVTMAGLPLTANGKVDTRALPAPSREKAPAPPETPLERAIAAVFADVLGVDGIGVDDDFFTAGGHSLLAVRTVARLRGELSLPLQLRDLFVAPTVRALAVRALALRVAAASGEDRSRLLGGAREEGP